MASGETHCFEQFNLEDEALLLQWLNDEELQGITSEVLSSEIDEDVELIQLTRPQRLVGDTVHSHTIEEVLPEEDLSTAVRQCTLEPRKSIDKNKAKRVKKKKVKKNLAVKWRQGSFLTTEIEPFTINHFCDEIGSPITYFMKYINQNFFEQTAHYTNMYAFQQNSTMRPATPIEIRQLVALHLLIGILKYPRIHMYWNSSIKLSTFVDTMAKNRFFSLRNHLHLRDTSITPSQVDRFWKVRPLYESIRSRCLALELEQDLCIDEQMVPFTGKIDVRQYVKGKPNPWGIKIFFLCGKSGLAYDFIIYQGATTELDQKAKDQLGVGAAVVWTLSQRLLMPNHRIYFDNYFSSYELLKWFQCKRIFAAGTIRVNRFRKPPLTCEKKFKKMLEGLPKKS